MSARFGRKSKNRQEQIRQILKTLSSTGLARGPSESLAKRGPIGENIRLSAGGSFQEAMKKPLFIILLLPEMLAAELPKETEDLISKLNDWELERQIALQNEIKSKRAEVVKVLRAQLKEKTRTGNLDDAVAIEKEIERLAPAGKVSAMIRRDPVPAIPKDDEELTELIRGTRWKFPNGRILTLRDDGRVDKSWGKLHPIWSVKEMKLRYEGKVLTFNNDFSEMTEITQIDFTGPGKRVAEASKD